MTVAALGFIEQFIELFNEVIVENIPSPTHAFCKEYLFSSGVIFEVHAIVGHD